MNEAGFWSDSLRPKLITHCQRLKYRHHFERVENAVALGTPDVDYCIHGVAGKIELKFSPTHPARDTSMVLGSIHGLRRSQIVYAARRTWCGGLIWCCIGTPEVTWLVDLRPLDAPGMAALAVATPSRLNEISAWRSNRDKWGTLPLVLVDDRVNHGFPEPRCVQQC